MGVKHQIADAIEGAEKNSRAPREHADWETLGLPSHITRLRAPPTDPPTREQVLNGVEGALRKLDRLPSDIGRRKEIVAAKQALAVVIEFLTGAVS
jgi:hypothetical protein